MSSGIAERAQRKHRQLQEEIESLSRQLDECRAKARMLREVLGTDPERPASAGRKRGPRGKKPTIQEGICRVVAEAEGPISTTEIVEALRAMGIRAAQTSVYGSISRLKGRGVLKARPKPGRGDAYVIVDEAAAPASADEPASKPARKAPAKAAAKKAPARKAAPRKKAASSKAVSSKASTGTSKASTGTSKASTGASKATSSRRGGKARMPSMPGR